MERPLALLFFLTLGVIACGLAACRMRRSIYRGPDSIIYFLSLLLVRIRWRAVVDPMPLTAGQGGVIVANHRSSIDPFFIQSAAPGYVHWMVAREYCEHPALAWFLRRSGAIPVRRGGMDTAATKTAIRLAEQGELVGMFPEGRINRSEELLLPVRPGAVLVALRARVPVVPCYISGSPYGESVTSPLWMSAKVRVRFGAPIDLARYAADGLDNEQIGALLLDVVHEIAVLAGQADFQARLAGKRWLPALP